MVGAAVLLLPHDDHVHDAITTTTTHLHKFIFLLAYYCVHMSDILPFLVTFTIEMEKLPSSVKT